MRSSDLTYISLIVIVIIIGILVVGISTKESYGDVLGSLGRFEKPLAECLSECERHSDRPGQGNISCDTQCYNIFSGLAKQDAQVPMINSLEIQCNRQCDHSDSKMKKRCASICRCHKNVGERCHQRCEYNVDKPDCIRQCSAVLSTNCNQVSWSFKGR